MGRYELLHRLAMGGMAELYVARHSGIEGFERTVVVKRVLPHLTDDPEFTRMFLDEARIAAALDHPNIAQVTDIDEQDGEFFFAMEYVHGRNLREVLKRAPDGLPLPLALTIVAKTAAGLHHAHEAVGSDGRALGLVHRDVSPSNVMVGYNGSVKLTDFGIAKASARTAKTVGVQIKGKVGYMSPEQCRGEDVQRQSDVFALGIVLYEATTGARAFYAPNDFAAMARIIRADYTPPNEIHPHYPQALMRIVSRALAKDPEDRYPTVAEFLDELEGFAEAEGHTPSETALSAYMEAHFGSPIHPHTLPAPPAIGSSPRLSAVSSGGISRPVFLAAIVLSAAAAGAAAFAFAAGQPTEQEPPSSASQVERPRESTENPAVDEVAPKGPGGPTLRPYPNAPAPQPVAVASGDETRLPVADVPPPAAPKETKRRRSDKRKRKRKKPAAAAKPSPFPPGYER